MPRISLVKPEDNPNVGTKQKELKSNEKVQEPYSPAKTNESSNKEKTNELLDETKKKMESHESKIGSSSETKSQPKLEANQLYKGKKQFDNTRS